MTVKVPSLVQLLNVQFDFSAWPNQSSVLAGVDGAREVEAEIAFVRAVHERSFRFVRGACDDAADELRPGCPRDDEFAGIVAIGVDRTDVRQADQSAEITCRGNGFRPGEGQCGLVGDFRQCRTVVIDGQRAATTGVACDTDMLPASERFFISAAASSV